MQFNVIKNTAATQTIVGPAGVSNEYAVRSPKTVDSPPIIEAITAIISGLRANVLAAAAGIISIATISKTPTIFIAKATVIPKERVKKSFSRCGLIPLAKAKSSFKVIVKRGSQRHEIITKTNKAPNHMTARSLCETAKISPKR